MSSLFTNFLLTLNNLYMIEFQVITYLSWIYFFKFVVFIRWLLILFYFQIDKHIQIKNSISFKLVMDDMKW